MEIEGRQIPNSLRRQRLIHGYSQVEVAQILGLKSSNQVSLWEKGECTPSLEHCIRLSILYQVLIEELYFDYLKLKRKEYQKMIDRKTNRKSTL
jgi:transcriptional regulator with XRE-family HTH domain